MKRKHLALLLAAAMTVTSVDATALVSAADFSAEVTDEAAVQEEEAVPADEEAADVDIADEETADVSDETAADVESEDAVTEDIQAEDNAEEADFTSEIKEDVAVEVGDGENNTTIPTSGVTALELDKTYAVDITADKKEQWFSFKPSANGKYSFYSVCSDDDLDPKMYLYDENAQCLDEQDDDDNDLNFYETYCLTAGKTYYYRATVFEDEPNSGTYNVSIIQTPTRTGITLNSQKMQKNYIKEVDELDLKGCNVTITYSDGKSWTRDVESGEDEDDGLKGFYAQGKTGEKYTLEAVKEGTADGTVIVKSGKFPECGTYKIRIKDEDENIIPGAEFEINVISKDQVTNTLNVGENKEVTCPVLGRNWYKFTADSDAQYYFNSDIDYMEVYDDNFTDIAEKAYRNYILEKGKTYFVKLCWGFWENNTSKKETGSITITKPSELTSLTYEGLNLTPVWGEADNVNGLIEGTLTGKDINGESYTMNLQDNVLFRDGATFNDKWGNTVTLCLKNSNGESVLPNSDNEDYMEWVKPGHYTYWFESGAVKSNKVTLTIQAPSYPTVKLGKTNIVSEGNKWVSFTPEETGYYSVEVENSAVGTWLSNLYYMDSAGMKQWIGYDDDNSNIFLTKGVTYFSRIYGRMFDNQGRPLKEQIIISISRVKSNTCKYTTTTTPATCATEGKIVETCQTHQGETITTVIPKKEHTPGAWTTAKEATVFAEGTSVQKCSVCGAVVKSQAITKLAPTLKLNLTAGKTVPMKVKQSFNVKVTGLANGDGVKSWKSNKTKIATVRNGKITAKKTGTAKITVTLNSGYTTWFKVKVQKSKVNTTSLKVLNKATGKNVAKKVTLKRRGKLNLSAVVAPVTSKQKVTFSSSKKSVATVNSKGVVTAKKKGKATITVKSGKKTVKIKITVK